MNELVIQFVSESLKISVKQIETVLAMLSEGNTVPFIARYRKEATSGLDEDQIREIQKHYEYELSVAKRKEDVIRLIEEKGLMTEELKKEIMGCNKLSEIEDLYRPFKEKKKTRATIAIAKGLEPFAKWILSLPTLGDINDEAKKYLNEEVTTIEDAISGAQDIIAEIVSDNPKFRKYIKERTFTQAVIKTKEKKDHEDEKKVYEMYYQYEERINRIVAHRILAINRAEKEKVIQVSIEIDPHSFYSYMYRGLTWDKPSVVEEIIKDAIEDSYKRLIKPSIDRELRSELTEKAQEQAMNVFSINVEKLLLQAPLKDKMVLGVDPAFRTGCKLAVVDPTGKVLMIDKIFPTMSTNTSKDEAKLVDIVNRYHIEVIAIGNGTASRETESFVSDTIKKHHLTASYVIISEAGASVYSASKVAQEEFPDFQVEERSAVSIARRLQDPLAELVKIDPKAISVGQYQHDMNQTKLSDQLDFVVTKTVNQVGVNLNTASPSLLSYVSGLSPTVAKSVVQFRELNGRFKNRKELSKVPKLGPKAFEQAAGFLRILDGGEILDQTSIHPESYVNARKILKYLNAQENDIGTDVLKVKVQSVNQEELSKELGIDHYTLSDILDAFVAPNRSPRDQYEAPTLKQDILKIEDLKEGMELEGTVRNVVDFGAFVDIGLKNDGLVHISKITKQFIKHPLEKVNVGDIVTVYVEKVDLAKGRVSLSMLPIN